MRKVGEKRSTLYLGMEQIPSMIFGIGLRDDTDVPFQIIYAVSVHKAQDLEYDLVKVINSFEILDSHGDATIFAVQIG